MVVAVIVSDAIKIITQTKTVTHLISGLAAANTSL